MWNTYNIKRGKKYKLYEALRALDKSEIGQIAKMLESSFFVRRKDVQKLFEFLSPFVLKAKVFPAKEMVFRKVFPSKPFDYALLRGTMSDLLEMIEEYLLIQYRRTNKIESRQQLTEIYRKKDVSKCYQSSVRKTGKLLDDQPLRNAYYYQQLLHFHDEKMHFQVNNQRTKNFNLSELSETLDILYLVRKLKHSITQLSHQQVFKTEYDYGLLHHLLPIIEQPKYLEIPGVAIYYYCFRFLSEEDGRPFFKKFKTILKDNKPIFESSELKVHYLSAINFCIRKLNQGHTEFRREILDLYQDGLEANYFLEDGNLSRFTFNNIVAAGIQLKEFDALFSHLDSFQIYIRRREVSDFHRNNYMNVIRMVRKLVNLLGTKKERAKLRQEILNEDILSERKWLLDKAAE